MVHLFGCLPYLLRSSGFDLHKSSFRDATCIRYGWQPPQLPSCPNGGFPILRYHELRDLAPVLIKDVCHNIAREPPLQPLSGEILSYSIAGADGARLDVAADGFGGPRVRELFLLLRWLTLSLVHTGISLYHQCIRW